MILELNVKDKELTAEYTSFDGTEELQIMSEAGHEILCESDEMDSVPKTIEDILKGDTPDGYDVEKESNVGTWDQDLWFKSEFTEFECSSVDLSAIPDIIRAVMASVKRNSRTTHLDPKDTPDTIQQ